MEKLLTTDPLDNLRENLKKVFPSILFFAGEILFNQEHKAEGLYLIDSGKVKLFKLEKGNEEVLRIAGAGDFLGYRGLVADSKYGINAEALEDTRIIFINKDEFDSLLKHDAFLNEKFI